VESSSPVLIPQIQYNTNDSWEIISGMDSGLGWPLLHQAGFASGTLYLLTIPENFADLYNLPSEVLDKIRETLCKHLGISLSAGPGISLFLYDNNTLVVESFNDKSVEVEILFTEEARAINDLSVNEKLVMEIIPEVQNRRGRVSSPEKHGCKILLPPHSFRIFKIEK
jgi:hypothetical protein